MKNNDNLTKIEPKKIIDSGNDILLTLSLIRNDLNDLIYLQNLHKKNSDEIRLPTGISADRGRIAGRGIYIFRLLLGHLYSILEFLDENNNLIENDQALSNSIKKLHPKTLEKWKLFIKLSSVIRKNRARMLDEMCGVKSEYLQLVLLSSVARNDLTYHYYGSIGHIKRGYQLAFFENEKLENTEYAYITEIDEATLNRSYYIDISIQKYLENKIGLSGDLISLMEKHAVDLTADFYSVISMILKDYHEEMVNK